MCLIAGTGREDITPVKPMTLFGYPHVPRLSIGVHDPLFATSLYLKKKGERLLFISLDLLMLSTQFLSKCRADISRSAGIPETHIMVSATHTHSGPISMDLLAFSSDTHVPPVDPDYLSLVHSAVLSSALKAINTAEPAQGALS